MTASRRCELITEYAAQACQCLLLVFSGVHGSLDVLTHLLALENANRLLAICSATGRQAGVSFDLADVESHYKY